MQRDWDMLTAIPPEWDMLADIKDWMLTPFMDGDRKRTQECAQDAHRSNLTHDLAEKVYRQGRRRK